MSGGGEGVTVHEGGCLCGALRFLVAGDPVAVSICHCENCRKNSGSAFSVNAIFAGRVLELAGTPAVYEDVGETGNVVRRLFCGRCGTPIESQSVYSVPGYTVIKAGAFDDPARFVPDSEVYCGQALPWVLQGGERARYDRVNTDSIAEPLPRAEG
ncbi:MAG: GFA family protein [Parafilimonas terrae]|nr:GFA family protein [Parafilimonas terrae]